MTPFDSSNIIFQTAASFVNQTNRHIFLTGKAGTGKTTFLKYVKETSHKKIAVVAPTGVAAINAGGVTIHSLFQIPPGMYLASRDHALENFDGRCYNNHTLFRQMRMSRDKKQLLRELDLLIIDEVSMVRADLLDAMDTVLRYTRKQPHIPFGGVQILYIGDLFQLPPVTLQNEWELMKEFYQSPFFFDARAIQQLPPVYIELKEIYRQHDEDFINILNNIRNNCCTDADLDRLHNYYAPQFSAPSDQNFITLTTHNDKAVAINSHELKKLSGRLYQFKADINREFGENSYPADELLQLKKGAQVMFIRNDTGEFRRYYNGKIGFVHSIDDNKIQIAFPGETQLLDLEKETWKNIRYHYLQEKDRIDEEELGTFTQYPIRLAWAITIHKSQGLTFDKAIIDAGASFASGQVYVALSRLTSLNGLVLKSRIYRHSIHTDERVLKFMLTELSDGALQQLLRTEQQQYTHDLMLRAVSWKRVLDLLSDHLEDYESRNLPDIDIAIAWAQGLIETVKSLEEIALKFQRQLRQLFEFSEQGDHKQSQQRIFAGCNYFIKETDDKLLTSLNNQIDAFKIKKRTRRYVNELYELKHQFERRKLELQNLVSIACAFYESGANVNILQLTQALHRPLTTDANGKKLNRKKIEKGETQRISLELFKKGKSIADIATARGLAYSTIESHLARFIVTGEIEIFDIVDRMKLERISALLEKYPSQSVSEIRQQLGVEFSYNQIRAVMSFKALTSPSF